LRGPQDGGEVDSQPRGRPEVRDDRAIREVERLEATGQRLRKAVLPDEPDAFERSAEPGRRAPEVGEDDALPLRRLRPIDAYGGSDERSLAADNTAAFNCRYAVAPGPKRWSVHSYGLAVDVNPVENPYLEGGRVHPRAGRAYLDRSVYRPGMAVRGGLLVAAFAAVGWTWGGTAFSSPDYQHFSKTGG